MALIEGILPPSRENWEWAVLIFSWFPIVTIFQWAIVLGWMPAIYSAGKTSTETRFNVPGKLGWITMEIPGFLTVLYIMWTLPDELGVKLQYDNWIMAGVYTFHYIYRAIIGPLISPSMSPMHIGIWAFAFSFQVMNGICIGGWLGGHGNITRADWSDHSDSFWASARMELGLMIMGISFFLNVFHDEELREIRRAAARNQKRRAANAEESTGKGKGGDGKVGVDKVYMIPMNGGFWWIFYPHYLAEWCEWLGFYIMGGPKFIPGRIFVINEITTMMPRAVEGKNWYIKKFGKEKVAGRKAVIPGLL